MVKRINLTWQKDDKLALLYAMAFMYAAIISMNSALLGAWVSTLPAISFSASLSPCAQQVPISVRRACSTECGFTPKCFAVSGYNRFVISWILSPEITTYSIMYIA